MAPGGKMLEENREKHTIRMGLSKRKDASPFGVRAGLDSHIGMCRVPRFSADP